MFAENNLLETLETGLVTRFLSQDSDKDFNGSQMSNIISMEPERKRKKNDPSEKVYKRSEASTKVSIFGSHGKEEHNKPSLDKGMRFAYSIIYNLMLTKSSSSFHSFECRRPKIPYLPFCED